MGYRDEFYIIQNIIGYTGSPQNNPTVYFDNNVNYGSITQFHTEPKGVGRAALRQCYGHSRLNYDPYIKDYFSNPDITEDTGRVGAMIEERFGIITHISRNPFIPIKKGNTPLRNLLSIAICKFQSIKARDFQLLLNAYYTKRNKQCSPEEWQTYVEKSAYAFSSIEQEIKYICQVEGLRLPSEK